MSVKPLEQVAINALRALSIDMVEKANSGHPGMPMGAAPMAYELYMKHIKHNPSNPKWFNRDRFVLSGGHGSPLLYSILHLTGYDISMDDLKNYRQLGSKAHGHPEVGTPGIEGTTGPLGQGFGMAVGMAMAEAHMGAVYNREGHPIIDHFTYVICGDGDLMEGITYEAASLAGHLGLGKLIVLYDSNDVCLDGELRHSFTEDIGKRFEAQGWHYLRVDDGNDITSIGEAINLAKQDSLHPSLIEIKTVIGYGSPNKGGTNAAHGAPLGNEEALLAKKSYGWNCEPFEIPEDVVNHFQSTRKTGDQREAEWNELFSSYKEAYPEMAKQLEAAIKGGLPEGWDANLPLYKPGDPDIATREASGAALNAIAKNLPTLFGGSADLASSNKTNLNGVDRFSKENYAGRNVWFGIREHAMGAILNGLSLHGGIRPLGATFFVFSDYLRPTFRLAAMMKLPVIYVFTHDSIAVGEDGPTHQPVEHLASLRAIPGLTVIRPADACETIEAYRYAMENKEGPTALILSRQNLPLLTFEKAREGVAKGGYILSDPPNGEKPKVLLIATGSEVSLAMETHKVLAEKAIPCRVVNMPSWELFEKQSETYKDYVLPSEINIRVSIETGSPMGWEKYTGQQGSVISVITYGDSGPGNRIIEDFGFTVDRILELFEKYIT